MLGRSTHLHAPRSESYGPFQAWDELNIQSYSQLLFRKYAFLFPIISCSKDNKKNQLTQPHRSIKKDEMSLTLFMNPYDRRFHLLLRCNHKARPYFSCRPVQDLHVTRSGASGATLHFSRWSASQRRYNYWAVVHLRTYEGMLVEQGSSLTTRKSTEP